LIPTNRDVPAALSVSLDIPMHRCLTYYGLHALQHRGQEAAGIVARDFDTVRNRYHFNLVKGMD